MICMPRSGMEKSHMSRNKAIERALARDKQVLKNQVQLLLVGRPRAGKTTLVRQLRLKNGDSFTQEETEAAKMALLENLTDAMKSLLSAREEMSEEDPPPWSSATTEDDAMALSHLPLSTLVSERGWEDVISMLVRLWQEDRVRSAWTLSASTSGMDCLPHFLEDPRRICDQKYSPTVPDMLSIYQTSTGVCDCAVQGEATFRLVEMGGRSLTTPKLLHYFDNVTAVIFMASCCDVERKDGDEKSEFDETCQFFSMVANDKSLQKLPVILLITKLDVLMEKGATLDLRTMFPSMKGDPQEVREVQKCLVDVFRGLCGPRPFYYHFMKCTDLNSVQQVFVEMKRDIRDSLLRRLLPQ